MSNELAKTPRFAADTAMHLAYIQKFEMKICTGFTIGNNWENISTSATTCIFFFGNYLNYTEGRHAILIETKKAFQIERVGSSWSPGRRLSNQPTQHH